MEILKTTDWVPNTMDEITVCPKCGSTKISWTAGGITGEVYRCNECNYVGSFILQVKPKDLVRFREELRKDKN
jgi:ribosomal protein L37AE/L43A